MTCNFGDDVSGSCVTPISVATKISIESSLCIAPTSSFTSVGAGQGCGDGDLLLINTRVTANLNECSVWCLTDGCVWFEHNVATG
jgi:hypothetical protein